MISLKKSIIIVTVLVYASILNHPVESVREKRAVITAKLTNLRCACLDKSFCKIEECRLKPVSRNQVNAFLNVTVLKRPVTNCLLNFETFRKTSVLKYHVLPINVTFDACKFIENQSKLPFMSFIYAMFRNNTNMNHTCPYYEKNIYIINAGPSYHPYFDFVPEGEYMAKIRFIVDGEVKGIGHMYFERRHPTNKYDD